MFNTYFGGNGSDVGNAIAVDSSGSCYVTGSTTSTNLPTRTPFQPVNRGSLDAFVAKFNASGSLIIYSSYLGGSFGEVGRGIAVDLAGNAFITGTTFSDNFTTTAGAFQATNRGQGDAFVTRVNPAGTALVYSSFLGGAGSEEGAGIAIDNSGNAYITGNTVSADFNTRNPLQANNRGQQDVFVTKVNSNGSALVYSTYLGGQLVECRQRHCGGCYGRRLHHRFHRFTTRRVAQRLPAAEPGAGRPGRRSRRFRDEDQRGRLGVARIHLCGRKYGRGRQRDCN